MKMTEWSEDDFYALIPSRKLCQKPTGLKIKTVHYSLSHNFTVVVILANHPDEAAFGEYYVGVAKLDANDQYNINIGLRIAASRAWNEMLGLPNSYGRGCPGRNDIFRYQGARKTADILCNKLSSAASIMRGEDEDDEF